ncbi:MAG TPA: response regulator transcription factor [Acidimicrobiales bacterium]|nr:response regulator transcription factor [Acidimicrobiales bacterium]
MPAPIVIVEDDSSIGGALARTLEGLGYTTRVAPTVTTAREAVDASTGLVILDLGLPDGDGLDVCREIRRLYPATQILILTARGSEADIVLGLDAGADDYLVKPFRLAELMARVRACVRRVEDTTMSRALGDLVADAATRSVTVAGEPVELRPKEFDLLWKLLASQDRVVPREELMAEVWDEHWYGSTKTLDIHIWALRQKLDQPGAPSRITTVRGVGYRIVAS